MLSAGLSNMHAGSVQQAVETPGTRPWAQCQGRLLGTRVAFEVDVMVPCRVSTAVETRASQ